MAQQLLQQQDHALFNEATTAGSEDYSAATEGMHASIRAALHNQAGFTPRLLTKGCF